MKYIYVSLRLREHTTFITWFQALVASQSTPCRANSLMVKVQVKSIMIGWLRFKWKFLQHKPQRSQLATPHLLVELYTLSPNICQALPASGSLTPYLPQKVKWFVDMYKWINTYIEEQPSSSILKEPLREIHNRLLIVVSQKCSIIYQQPL